MRKNQNVAQISEFEWHLVETLKRATFPVGHAHKRFIRDMLPVSKISDRGRWFLAHIAHRYRRQYHLSTEQIQWVNEWLSKDAALETEPKPASVSVRMESNGAQGSTLFVPETRKDELMPDSVSSGWLFGSNEQECTSEVEQLELGGKG